MEETRLLRLRQIIGDPERNIPPLVPVSRTTVFEWVRDGRFPKPFIRKPRFTAWRLSDILGWIEAQQEGGRREEDSRRPRK